MANIKVKQANGKTASVSTVGGKKIAADNQQGFKDGEEITAYNLSDTVEFTVKHAADLPASKQHVEDGTVITLHAIDAAILEKAGRGSIKK